jgi:hypothetical protein
MHDVIVSPFMLPKSLQFFEESRQVSVQFTDTAGRRAARQVNDPDIRGYPFNPAYPVMIAGEYVNGEVRFSHRAR